MSSEAAESAKAQVYEVTVLFDASASVKVRAHSPEEAAHLAEDEANGRQHLCHQCSDEIETGDILGSIVYCAGEQVAETTWSAERIAALEAERDTLRAEVERLRKDGERLDWMQQAMGEADEKLPQLCTDTGEFFFTHTQNGQEFVESGTFELRRIIDSAIEIDRAIEAAKEAK